MVSVADVLPIAVFIYSYVFLALRRYLGLAMPAAVFATLAFAVFNMGFERALARGHRADHAQRLDRLPPGRRSARCRRRVRSRVAGPGARPGGAALAAAIFALSLTFRSIDHAVCEAVPVGTHFVWHTLNAVVLFILMRAAIVDGARLRTAEAAVRAAPVRRDPRRA